MGIKGKLIHIYDKHYKKLMILSFLILLASIVSLGVGYAQTGEFFAKGVSLQGGITMTVPLQDQINVDELEKSLSEKFPEGDFSVREVTERGVIKAIIIEAAEVDSGELEASLPALGVELVKGEYTLENMGSALGSQFYSQTLKAVIYAFIAMALVVFITFRSIIPSSFVILAAVSDIISTLAVVNLLDVRISTAGIAAFLMLIGYSVDTDILLTTRVLKRKREGGSILERTLGAMRTGMTMTGTAIIASLIGLMFTQSDTIYQIMLIISIGLFFDLVYTWLQNANILRWYMERQEQHGKN